VSHNGGKLLLYHHSKFIFIAWLQNYPILTNGIVLHLKPTIFHLKLLKNKENLWVKN